VNGYVAKRVVDPGAFVSQNMPIVDVVDISTVRLVASVVEKDLKELQTGNATRVDVDAFPGEVFMGRIARVSPVLDPATRTAQIEIEIPNPGGRLKPGMYARVSVTTSTRKEALVIPATSVVDLGGRRGVFTPLNETAVFRALDIGTEQNDIVEVLGGLANGDTVITTGSSALRDGDRIVLPGGSGRGGRRGAGNGATTTSGRGGDRTGSGASGRGGEDTPAAGPARDGGARRLGGSSGTGDASGRSFTPGTREGGAREGGGRDGARPGNGDTTGREGRGRRTGGAPSSPAS
jgi:hypothetical protein